MIDSGKLFVIAALVLASAAPVYGQSPVGAETLSPAAVADSQRILADLDQHLRASPKDAAGWYRNGMVAWALTVRSRAPNAPRGLDPTTLGRKADTSLRIAAQLEPKNVYYRLMVGRFLLSSGVTITRAAAPGFFDAALEVSRKGTDSIAHAEAAIDRGRVHWRRYDALANRRMETTPGAAVRSISAAAQPASGAPSDEEGGPPQFSMKTIREAMLAGSQALPPDVSGATDMAAALSLFREAYSVAPGNARAFRSVAMVLAEKSAWNELEIFAQHHVDALPWDPSGWLALGLALQREKKSTVAAAAFDSALTMLSPSERARLDRLERVLPGSDSAKRARGESPPSAAVAKLYWTLADPLWSQSGNESRVEFLARVTFSELRWTVEEMHVRGADSDRGDIYIRYGPPELIAAFGPNVSPSSTLGMEQMNVSTVWAYNTGLLFVFNGAPSFATAHTATSDVGIVGAIKEALPVRWDNLTSVKVDSMPTQIVRFRGGRDSLDLLVAMDPPVDSIRAASQHGANVRGDIWFLAANTSILYRDSLPLDTPGIRNWSKRVAPGVYIIRGEASATGVTRAGQTTAIVDGTSGANGLAMHGFGISDVLLTTKAEPRAGIEKRWSDLAIAPLTGSISRRTPLEIVWENYEFGDKSGSANYEISITLKQERTVAGQVAATIVGGLARAARVDRGADYVALTFDRTLPHAAAFVDHVALSLGETPLGSYTLTLKITDHATGQSVTRTKSVRIRA